MHFLRLLLLHKQHKLHLKFHQDLLLTPLFPLLPFAELLLDYNFPTIYFAFSSPPSFYILPAFFTLFSYIYWAFISFIPFNLNLVFEFIFLRFITFLLLFRAPLPSLFLNWARSSSYFPHSSVVFQFCKLFSKSIFARPFQIFQFYSIFSTSVLLYSSSASSTSFANFYCLSFLRV